MAEEQVAAYRGSVWGGCTPARRDRIADSFPADTDYAEMYAAAFGAWAERRRQ